MLIFHEGLPRSGKSYAAMRDHIIPALQKGRKVFAYIAGLDFDKIASVAEITIQECRRLLHQIEESQVLTIWQHVEKDSLVVIDELQNFWPSSRQKLGPEITKFITEHGHDGLDLLLMGQVMNDCHSMWKGRVDQLVQFYKRDAIGKPNEYKWTVLKRGANMKFQEVTSGVLEYEEKYFGCYKSHTDGTTNKTQYVDQRANIWNSPVLRRTLPIYIVIAVIALGVVIWAFSGGLAASTTKKQDEAKAKHQEVQQTQPAPAAHVPAPPPPVQAKAEEYMPVPAPDIVEEFTAKYRIRLAGSMTFKGKTQGYIEWRDTDNGVKETLSFHHLQGLGWLVLTSPDGQMAMLQKVHKKLYVTAWPIENVRGQVSPAQIEQIKPASVKLAQAH